MGLEGVDFDKWTNELWDAKEIPPAWSTLPKDSMLANHAVARVISTSFIEMEGVCASADVLLKLLPALCARAETCRSLIGGLLLARQRIRESLPLDTPRDKIDPAVRDRLLLLDAFAVEAAILMARKFPDTQAFLSMQYQPPQGTPCPGRQIAMPPYIGGSMCHGDVIIAEKWSPYGVFGRADDLLPSYFMHSAVAYVPENYEGAPKVIDSNLDRGLMVRPFAESFPTKQTWRVRVYRLRGAPGEEKSALRAKLHAGIDLVEKKMAEAAGGSPEKKSAAPFDFEANMKDPNRVFCAEAVLDAYELAGFSGWLNPYPAELWRRNLKNEAIGSFMVDAAGMDPDGFPGPGVVDLNARYELVLEALNGRGLDFDHVGEAVIEAFLDRIREKDERLARYREKVLRLPTGPATRFRILKIAATVGTPNRLSRAAGALRNIALDGVTERSAVSFFVLFGNILAPEGVGPASAIRKRVAKLESERKRSLGANEIRKIADEEMKANLDVIDEWLKRF